MVKVKGKKKKNLKLIGYIVLFWFVSILIHNLIYGVFGVEEPVFFILAVIVLPILFLVGVIKLILVNKS